MKAEDVINVIDRAPLGSRLQVVKKDGKSFEVSLQSNQLDGRESLEFNGIKIPALPDAMIVAGAKHGDWRLDIADLVKIARI